MSPNLIKFERLRDNAFSLLQVIRNTMSAEIADLFGPMSTVQAGITLNACQRGALVKYFASILENDSMFTDTRIRGLFTGLQTINLLGNVVDSAKISDFLQFLRGKYPDLEGKIKTDLDLKDTFTDEEIESNLSRTVWDMTKYLSLDEELELNVEGVPKFIECKFNVATIEKNTSYGLNYCPVMQKIVTGEGICYGLDLRGTDLKNSLYKVKYICVSDFFFKCIEKKI